MTEAAATPTPPAPKRYDNPARDAFIASVGDPAFDRSHPAWVNLRDRYIDTRSIADLAALPVLPEQWPQLWRVRPLTTGGRATAYTSATPSLQRITALRLGLVSRVDGPRTYDAVNGTIGGATEIALPQVPNAPLPQVTDAALDEASAQLGGDALDELADVILHRADGSPRRMLPFPLPPRSALQ